MSNRRRVIKINNGGTRRELIAADNIVDIFCGHFLWTFFEDRLVPRVESAKI